MANGSGSIASLVFALMLAALPATAQTDFPKRHIHVILPYPAGGIVDIATRIVTDKLSGLWRQPFVVEAKPAGGGNVAWDQVSRAAPDGYTWTFIGPAIMANPRMYANLRWSDRSFTPVAAIAWAPSVLVVHPSVPVNTMAEFIDYVRARPGVLNWGNPGIGTSQHLNTAIFLTATKLDMLAVPYGGQPPAILDLRANRVQFNVSSIGLVTEHVVSGAVKALAVLGTVRSPLLPSTPTVSEAGYPEINVVPWYGFAVPSGTPQPVVEKIAVGFNEVIKTAQVRELLQKQGLEPMQPMNLAELARLYEEHTQKYANIVREAGIKRSD